MMTWQHESDDEPSSPPKAGGLTSRTSIAGNVELPRWESFPLQDRHRLVGLIVQTARRRLPPHPAPSDGDWRR
jgi:hypothetical protein